MTTYNITSTTYKHIEAETNGHHFADDIFKCIFLNENVWIPIKISLKFVLKDSINTFRAMVQIMAWRGQSDKPLSEPMMVSLPTHICVTRPQWVNNRCSIWHKKKMISFVFNTWNWSEHGLKTNIAKRISIFLEKWVIKIDPKQPTNRLCRLFSVSTMKSTLPLDMASKLWISSCVDWSYRKADIV